MEVRIVPFAASMYDIDPPAFESGGELIRTTPDCSEHLEAAEGNGVDDHLNAAYWGIYLGDKRLSLTSNRELAEKVKLWIETWLKDRHL